MNELILDVRIDGCEAPAGNLARDGNGALAFAYRADYLARIHAQPLSLSLPLTDEPYGDVTARAFFDNLLQERDDALAPIMAREGLSRDDVAGLLLHLGKDCPGALSVLPTGSPAVKVPGDPARDYVALSETQFAKIILNLHERRNLPAGTSDPSPLAGVQSKIALTLLPDGQFAQPKPGSGAPTTHILKVPDRDHRNDAAYEAATLDLSRSAGIDTAAARVLRIGDLDVLLVTRFDRATNGEGHIVRLHQEDFAQAMGLPAALKYERRGTNTRRFDAMTIRKILDSTTDPAGAKALFIQATVFDLLTGNTDAHAKNHSLRHLGGGQLALTPRYDLLPTRLDPNISDELSFSIGSAKKLQEITTADFDAFLTVLGIATPAARKRITARSAMPTASTLERALPELDSKAMKQYADLIAANLRYLMPVLGHPVPVLAQNRDAFVNQGGGWLQS